jgi:hypothetical protein
VGGTRSDEARGGGLVLPAHVAVEEVSRTEEGPCADDDEGEHPPAEV